MTTRRLRPGPFGRRLPGTAAFIYHNSHWIAAISVAWTLASLPVVTVGPATLGAYVAILGLQSDRNRVELDRVVSVVRQQLAPAVAFGLAPTVFFALSAGYLYALARAFTTTRFLAALVTFYVGLYLSLVMIPTFVALAHGRPGVDALRAGVGWVGANPTLAMLTGLGTLAVLVVTSLLLVAFVLLFAGVAFSLQIRLVGEDVV
jgi:hypothetical protein